MASKVCPVCKFFVSSSNTTMNVHMDQCLRRLESDGTKLDDTTKTSSNLKSKLRKKRLMVDIYATAQYCTLEDLDRRNGTTWARELAVVAAAPAGGKPPSTETRHDGDEPVYVEPPTETKRRRLMSPTDVRCDIDESVYADSNGVKLRILSKLSEKPLIIPGEESKPSKPAMEPEFGEGKGVLVRKKKQFGSKPLMHMKVKQLSKKLSSFEVLRKEIQAPPAKEDYHVEARRESEEANLPLAAGNVQISRGRAALGKWVCSKRSDLPKKMKKSILKCSENPMKSPSLQSHDVNSSWSTEDLRSSPKTKRVDPLPTMSNEKDGPSGSGSALANRPQLKVLSRSSRNATARSSGGGHDTSMKAKKIVSLKTNILARMPSSPLEPVNDDDGDTGERIPKTFRKRRSERGGKLASDTTGTSKKVRNHRSSFSSSTLSSRIGGSMEWMLPSGRNLPESVKEEEEEVIPMEEPGHSTPEQKPLEAECPDIVFSFSSIDKVSTTDADPKPFGDEYAQSFTHEEQASPRLNDKKEIDVQLGDEVAFGGEGKSRVVRTRAETASADQESSACLTSHGGVGLDAPPENSSVTSYHAKSDQCQTPGSTASAVSIPPQEAYRPEGSKEEPTARPEQTGEPRVKAIATRNEELETISQAKEQPGQVSDCQGCCCSRREGTVPSRGMQISALRIAPPRQSASFVSYTGLTELTKLSPESGAVKLPPAAYGGFGSNSASSPSQTPPTPNSVLRLMGKDLMVLKEDQSTPRPSNPQPAPSENSSPRLGVGPAPTVPNHESYWYNYSPQLRDGPCVFGQVFPVAIHQFPLHPRSMKRMNTTKEVIVIDDSLDTGCSEMAAALPKTAVSNPIAQQRQFACFPSHTQYVSRDVSGGFRPVFSRPDAREVANAVRSAGGLCPLLPNPFYFRSTSTGQHHGQPVYYA